MDGEGSKDKESKGKDHDTEEEWKTVVDWERKEARGGEGKTKS